MKKNTSLLLVEYLLWLINPAIILLCIFSDKILPHPWLSWIGNWHPAVLHFPIVLGFVLCIYLIFNYKKLEIAIEKKIFLIHALFSSITALLGVLNAIGENYDHSLLLLHKWGGLSIALLAWSWVIFENTILTTNVIYRKIFGSIYFLILVFFTHKGGQLTHGKNVFSIPNKVHAKDLSNKPDSTLSIYEKAVQPILANKCISCHGGNKIKGDLQLTSIELIQKGGKLGDFLTDRIHMPLSEEKHMPPMDQTQLTKEEITILTKWFNLGGDLGKSMRSLQKSDSLYILASQYIAPSPETKKEQKDLSEYNSDYVNVQYDYYGSDKINVKFSQGKFYKTAYLEKLKELKDQIITLNMQQIPLQKKDIDIIASFSHIVKLNLNDTKLSLQDLSPLLALKELKSLSLVGMPIEINQLENFVKKSKLSHLHLWTSGLTEISISPLAKKYPATKFIVGDNLENAMLKLNDAMIHQDSAIFTQKLQVGIRHFLKGVTIKYTVDGTEPDSIHSPTYIKPIVLTQNTTLKTKVFKPGWYSSDVTQKTFYKSDKKPDSILFITMPDPKYSGMGSKTLVDHELGDLNFGNGKWLGYSKNNMEFLLLFNKSTALREINFNTLVNTASHIFPIQTISIEGSEDGKHFHAIQQKDYTEITKAFKAEPNINQSQAFKVLLPKGTSYRYYKVIVRNLKKLPVWHSGKGNPAWIFIDELFITTE